MVGDEGAEAKRDVATLIQHCYVLAIEVEAHGIFSCERWQCYCLGGEGLVVSGQWQYNSAGEFWYWSKVEVHFKETTILLTSSG